MKPSYSISQRWARKTLEIMISYFPKKQSIPTIGRFQQHAYYSLSLALVDDPTIHRLNRQFRHKDAVTDVLSIEGEIEFLAGNQNEEIDLGEVIISYPQTQRQAKEHGVSTRHEFEKLFIHGFLHALGFDHIKDSDARRMMPLEEYMKDVLDAHRPLFPTKKVVQ